MIHYHGVPLGANNEVLARFCIGRHIFVSFAYHAQINIVAKFSQSFAIDNGAFTMWKKGSTKTEWDDYENFVKDWKDHPGFDFALIPDVIDGNQEDNEAMVELWLDKFDKTKICPVWHMHEELKLLYEWGDSFHRIAIGSSGDYAKVGSKEWEKRMFEIMDYICVFNKQPICKVHGLRMLNPKIFQRFPFSSADSTNVARNISNHARWKGTYNPISNNVKAIVMADRIENFNSSDYWRNNE